jgi:hypothetical protein
VLQQAFDDLQFRKPSVLCHTEYLEECASSLAADPQCPSDKFIIHTVRAFKVSQDVTLAFDHGSREKIAELSDNKAQIMVRSLMKQADEWKNSVPPEAWRGGKHFNSDFCVPSLTPIRTTGKTLPQRFCLCK